MKKITAYIAALVLAIRDRFTPGTASLISQLTKLEATVEKAIAKDTGKLAKLDAAEKSIAAAKVATNRNVDAAYKLLHNVTSFTA